MPEERITPTEILAAAGADQPVTGRTFLQRTGLVLASAVGRLGVLIILILIISWVFAVPHGPPSVPAGIDGNSVKAILDNYKALQDAALQPYTTLFDSIIVKVLLPVFTSILGYIFGTRAGDKNNS